MIGTEIRERAFRDTRQLYREYPAGIVAPSLIRFGRMYIIPTAFSSRLYAVAEV